MNKNYFANKNLRLLAVISLLVATIWQTDTIKASLSSDRLFENADDGFKILVLPFEQMREMGGKNYDAGYVLAERLKGIARAKHLKISVKYWSDYHGEGDLSEQAIRALQAYHHTDMLIGRACQTADCPTQGDQIYLRYVAAETWATENARTNFSTNDERGGLGDLKHGKIQEKIENIATFISILAQFKFLNRTEYFIRLDTFLNQPDFSTDVKQSIYLEWGSKLFEEGKLVEALPKFEKGLQLAVEQGNKAYQSIFLRSIGNTHFVLGNFSRALDFFKDAIKLFEADHISNPQNTAFKNTLAIAYQYLGSTYGALQNLPQALSFFEKFNELTKELHESHPKNVDFTYGFAISHEKIGDWHISMGNYWQALSFFEKNLELTQALYKIHPQDVPFQNGLAISYEKLGVTHSALGNFQKAVAFFEAETKLYEALHASYPHNVLFQKSLAFSCEKLGETHTALGNAQKALFFLKKMWNCRRIYVRPIQAMYLLNTIGSYRW